MNRIRVLIVDGASTTRQTLTRLLQRDLDLDIVGAVASGRLALAKLSDLNPDVVLLDVSPPDLEGLKTLELLRNTHFTLPVLIFSRLTERGSQTTVDALLLGATDYVTKPESNADLERCVLGELTAKIKSLTLIRSVSKEKSVTRSVSEGDRSTGPQIPSIVERSPSLTLRVNGPSRRAEIVAIATSTGGPTALASLLSSLPASFTTPIVIVQHMAKGFTATLAESLRRQSGRSVSEVELLQPIAAASVWIAAGGRHLVVTRHGATVHVAPNDDPPENECRPSADVLFRSIADVFGSSALAVVLTGIGCDGLAGCRKIRDAGGTILVQDEASSIAWGMPGQVAAAGLADAVLPVTELPQAIVRRTTNSVR